ncbi:hypothetical protein SAMN05216215_103166 [Saccharopolyspora shandongensis]|uniref:Uncharacterized protein n=1 Tax=Saccharopolyspora shandongensis TaxID=418495 RepID=A0A1H3LGS4_9PSEU|nr:hypothetical protein [Saccharopolyspora shandongensis]SDY63613.1 hypothetical protein SAMN05216215_103166 [Saccharopolyspora shandongensis]
MTEAHNSAHRSSLWPVGPDGRPKVRVGTNPEAIRVLTQAVGNRLLPDTYVQDGAPVVVEAVSGAGDPTAGDDDVALPLTASLLRPALLAGLLAEHAYVYRPELDKEGRPMEIEMSPSGPVLNAVLAPRSWPELPVLRRIISTPVLRPDGTLLQQPGYDPATGYFLAGRTHLEPVPEKPTPEQVATAREFLLERFLHDFPWRTPADQANYLGLLITPIIRPFTRALSPFGVIDATMPGSGKTILSGCVGLLVGQRVLTWTDSEDELRKAITTVLADQVGVIVFDNLEEGAVINSAVLARLVTERTWTDRKLGSNTASTFPNDRLWLATGNNLRVGGDMASRTVWVRLDPDCPRPEARSGFTIPNLDSWILDPANQATVLRHVLTLILDWTAAGAPISTRVPQMRQFTRWAQHIGGFLEHHDIPGFLSNAEESRELDDDDTEWQAFLLRWHALHGTKPMTANELRASAEPEYGTPDPWVGSFPTTATGKLLSPKSLGHRLTGQTGRWRGNVALRSAKDKHTKLYVYWVEHRPDAPTLPETTPQTPQTPQEQP